MIDFQVTCFLFRAYCNCTKNHVFLVTKIDFSKFTHIHYAFAIIVNGSVPAWENPQKANAQLTKLVTMAHKHKVKVLLSIGGWAGSITSRYKNKKAKYLHLY